MKVGELVNVRVRLGCVDPPVFQERGVGLVLDIKQSVPLTLKGETFCLGNDVVVCLDGRVEKFHESDVQEVPH